MNRLRRVLILAVALLLVVVAGLSITLYAIQTRHSQIIHEESRAVQRLKTGRIHKYKLGLTLCANAGDAVTRRLRLA